MSFVSVRVACRPHRAEGIRCGIIQQAARRCRGIGRAERADPAFWRRRGI